MILKSKRILTLLLTVLLIMSSMSALSVSAEATVFDANGDMIIENTTEYATDSTGTADITTGSDVVLNAVDDSVTYTISNVPESGMYMITPVVWTTIYDNKKYFTLTVSDGTNTWDGMSYYHFDSEESACDIKLGSLYLESGKANTFTINFTATSSTQVSALNVTKLKIEKVKPIALSTTEENKISIADWNVNRTVRRNSKGDEDNVYSWAGASVDTTWKGCYVFNGHYAIFRVSVPVDTYYSIYAMGGSNGYGKYALTLDGTTTLASDVKAGTKGYTVLEATKLAAVKLPAGTHDLKIEASGAAVFFGGLKIVPLYAEIDKDVNSTTSQSFSFRNDIETSIPYDIKGENFGANNVSIAAGQDFTADDIIPGGLVNAVNGKYASYFVKATEAGFYDISFICGSAATSFNVYVDGAQPVKSYYRELKGTGKYNANVSRKEAVTVYLTQGLHQIKFEFTNTSTNWLFMWEIEAADYTNISATDTTTIQARSTKYYDYTTATSEIDSTIVIARDAKTFYYMVDVASAGQYTLATNQGGANPLNMTVTDADTNAELYTGKIGDKTAGYTTYTVTELGRIPLKAGKTLLKIAFTGTSANYFKEFSLTPYIQNKVIADINTEIAQGTDYETVEVPIKFEGSAIMSALQVEVTYNSAVELTNCTSGNTGANIILPNISAKPNPVVIQHLDLNGVGMQLNEGVLATLEFKVPNSTAKDYEFTVVIKEARGQGTTDIKDSIETANGVVKVVSTDPIITFTNASGETVNEVVSGTMNMRVELNGNTGNLIMFAIYTKDGDYAVMKYQTDATTTDGVATAQINQITLEGGKDYYAKVFIWDTSTYYGSVYTLGE